MRKIFNLLLFSTLVASIGVVIMRYQINKEKLLSTSEALPSSVVETSPEPETESKNDGCLSSLPDTERSERQDAKAFSSEELESEADALAEQGKAKEALKAYSLAYTRYYGELGRAMGRIASGRLPDQDINTKAESPEFKFKIGRAYFKNRQYQAGAICFSESLEDGIEKPNDASAYLNRAEAYRLLGKKTKALADYQKAAELFKVYKLPQYQKQAIELQKLVR